MTVKQVAALIVAGLVAGVVLGSFGIAGAGGTGSQAAMPAAECSTSDCSTASDCGTGGCPEEAVAAPSCCSAGRRAAGR